MYGIGNKTRLITALSLSFFVTSAIAQQPRGYIKSDQGVKCWYTQVETQSDTYFHSDGVTSNTTTLTFDDPACMSDGGAGLAFSKMMINNVITRTYSDSDADFQTHVSEMYSGSLLQIKGDCIQSKRYPAIGVTVDYFVRNNSITGVIHGSAANGCRN